MYHLRGANGIFSNVVFATGERCERCERTKITASKLKPSVTHFFNKFYVDLTLNNDLFLDSLLIVKDTFTFIKHHFSFSHPYDISATWQIRQELGGDGTTQEGE
jgi:hypothetical protein